MTQPTLSVTPEIMKRGEEASVRRPRGGTYRDGVYVADGYDTFLIIANIQPMTGMMMMMVPEGERDKQHFDVFTVSKLRRRDIICKGDREYEVTTVEDWGRYTRSTAVLVDGQEDDVN